LARCALQARSLAALERKGVLERVRRVQTDLYGSLALTGKGHATDRAVLLGLGGELPDQVDPASIETLINRIRTAHSLSLGGMHSIPFEESGDLLFHKDSTLPAHPNGMRFRAFDEAKEELAKEVYYSVGGGFIKTESEMQNAQASTNLGNVPYPFQSAADLLRIGNEKAAVN
jgi:L-serine dehydratase